MARQHRLDATDGSDLGGYTTFHPDGMRQSPFPGEHIVASPGHPRLPGLGLPRDYFPPFTSMDGTRKQSAMFCAVTPREVPPTRVRAARRRRSMVSNVHRPRPSRGRIDGDVIGAVRATRARSRRPNRALFSNFFKFASASVPARTNLFSPPTTEPPSRARSDRLGATRHGGCQGKQRRRRQGCRRQGC